MSASESSVVMDGIEYSVIVEDGMVVGFRRYHAFNKRRGTWVELRFSQGEQAESGADSALFDHLIEAALFQLLHQPPYSVCET